MKITQLNALALLLATGGMVLPSCKGNSDQQQNQMAAPQLAVMTVSESDATLDSDSQLLSKV